MQPLKIHSPDEPSESPTTPNSAAAPPMLTLSTIQLAEFAASIVQQLQSAQTANASVLTHVEPPKSSSDDPRLLQPGVVPAIRPKVTLRMCADSHFARNRSRKSKQTWRDFFCTVECLEQVWGNDGPDVRDFTKTSMEQWFLARATKDFPPTNPMASPSRWVSPSIWIKRMNHVASAIKSCMRQTSRNRDGIPRGEEPLLSSDEELIWELPTISWFTKNTGYSPPVDLPALTTDELDRVLIACEKTPDPTFWKVLICFWHFCAMRRDDSFFSLSWYDEATRTGINLRRQWLTMLSGKNSEPFNIPLPSYLCDGLSALVGRHEKLVFFSQQKKTKDSKFLYTPLKAICKEAGIEYRTPTDFRKSCTTYWLDHSPDYANRFTAHREAGVAQRNYKKPNESQLRAAADRHPKPSVSLTTFEVSRAVASTDTNRNAESIPNAVS